MAPLRVSWAARTAEKREQFAHPACMLYWQSYWPPTRRAQPILDQMALLSLRRPVAPRR